MACLARIQHWACYARNLVVVVVFALLIGFFLARPRVESLSAELPAGVSTARVQGSVLGFFFRLQWRARVEAVDGRSVDVQLRSRLGHFQTTGPGPILLPVYYRDQILIRVGAGAGARLIDEGCQRTLLPGGWLVLALAAGAVWFFHWLASGALTVRRCMAVTAVGLSCCVSLVLVALVAQFAPLKWSRQQTWLLFPPLLDETFYIFPDITPGLPPGEVRFKTSSEGIRARERWQPWDQVFSVLCLGASTTEGLLLGEEHHWPRVLEKQLRTARGTNVWVGNAGHSGYSTARLVAVAGEYLPRTQPKYLVVLTGFNEGIVPDEAASPAEPNEARSWRARATAVSQRVVLIGWLRQFLFDHTSRSPNDVAQTRDNTYVVEARAKLQDEGRRQPPQDRNWDELDISAFERSLRRLHELALASGARLVLCTQPTIYRSDLTEGEARLLWMMGNYTPASKRRRMDRINSVTRRVAAELAVPLVDLDLELPRSTESFYDDCHFNVSGATRVAELLFRAISALDTRRLPSHP